LAGFGALFFGYTLQQLELAEDQCLSPDIRYERSLAEAYWDNDTNNPWEYYFEPVSPAAGVDAGLECRLGAKQIFDMNQIKFHRERYMYRAGELHELIRRYYRIRPEIQAAADAEWRSMFSLHAKVIGLHMRGTDRDTLGGRSWRVPRSHLGSHLYAGHVDKFLAENPGAGIYLATDDKRFAKEAMKRWQNIKMRDIPRAKRQEHLFVNNEGHKKEEGLNVLIDILLLTRCDQFLHGSSEVAWAVRWMAGKRSWPAVNVEAPESNAYWNYDVPAPAPSTFRKRMCPTLLDMASRRRLQVRNSRGA